MSTTTPGLVSMVIPTRNRARLLGDTLDAALKQSYEHLEIIVVDDASTDETDEVIRNVAKHDPKILSLRQPRQAGAAAARNVGARVARGEYLLFEDDDCRGVEHRIAWLVDALEQDSGAAYAYGWMRVIDAGSDASSRGILGPWSIGTPYALIRAKLFRAAGGFDEELPRLQDFDLWTRLLHERHAIEVPMVLFETLRDGSGISASPEKLRIAARHIRKKYPRSCLSARHLAEMHRILAGRLVVEGMRSEGLAHFRSAIRLSPADARSWLGFLSAVLGPAAYSFVVGLQTRSAQGRARARSGEPPLVRADTGAPARSDPCQM